MTATRIVPVLTAMVAASCGGQRSSGPVKAAESVQHGPAPAWVRGEELQEGTLCGLGVAGAGFDVSSPYPKRLSRERAVRNLAGILGTHVQEAIIDKTTNRHGTQVQTARVLTVDEGLIERIDALAETDYWLDGQGTGPYSQKGFTYAHACVDTSEAAVSFELDPAVLAQAAKASSSDPEDVPEWIDDTGKQDGGRVCAVGFSLPAFFADQTFERVVEDVRGQLSEVIETMVSSYYEELTTQRVQLVEAMTLATTQAMARGVVVTHYWYDRDGTGPYDKPETTYGWGCMYPVDVLQKSFAAVEATASAEDKNAVAKVKQRATRAFEDLDAEIAKREAAASGQHGATVTEAQGSQSTAAPDDAGVQAADGSEADSRQRAVERSGEGDLPEQTRPKAVPPLKPASSADGQDAASAHVAAGE